MGGHEPPIIVRGDGCYLEDSDGKRYLDALAGLFAVQIGYSYGDEVGQAAHEQMRELPFYTNWSYAHPRAIELAAEVADLAPDDLNRVFFVSGGSEANESIIKLAKQFRHSIRRLYAFSWTGANCVGFDAGLVRADGSKRPGYTTFRSKARSFTR